MRNITKVFRHGRRVFKIHGRKMQDMADLTHSELFGSESILSVTRGIAEFRAGRPVLMVHGEKAEAALPMDGLNCGRLQAFKAMCSPARIKLAVTASRARALGLQTGGAVTIAVDEAGVDTICAWAAGTRRIGIADYSPARVRARAGIDLAKLAQNLPAVLVARVDASKLSLIVQVTTHSVTDFNKQSVETLKIAAEANVPLEGLHPSRFVIFTNAIGDNSVAVIVGSPDFSEPVPVRLHSACLTGDVFGSRRCDCGDQLRLALVQLEEMGGGVILYMAQEGRGLGLANKMRAYQLQDAGLDTVDANTTLGFDDDERSYGVAARILQMLGCTRITLLTNNPAKLEALRETGIEIFGRVPLVTPINVHNRRYMTAKAVRGGHHLNHLVELIGSGETLDGTALGVKLAP
jgi:GTP cyclohydrolase II